MSAGGKGDAPRPFSVARAEFEARWDAIFNNTKVAKPAEKTTHMCARCGKPLGPEGHVHTCTPLRPEGEA